MDKCKQAVVIGSDINALQAAWYLARIGTPVKLVTDLPSFALPEPGTADARTFWSAVLNAVQHPMIEFIYNVSAVDISGGGRAFKVKTTQQLRHVDSDLCTGCKQCEENCSTRLTRIRDGKNVIFNAIHKPYPGIKSVPSAMVIDKNEIAPCRASCPLGINVQGFVSLLANSKIQEAYDLINSSAPLGGILGRLCKHPCESKCSRAKVDSAVSIRSLHRYAYDNVPVRASADVARSAAGAMGKIAIIGSGPAGLMAAWDLKRRGYDPTIFESHNVIGGMLATGIPRFRLSREIRERELDQLFNMGIRVRTGITVGRDVDFAYLRERDYKAFFLAIGASRNNRLNIPGEELSGVIDCMSFLLTLNLTDDVFVGRKIVIIGDGNSAVDSARAAIRQNKGDVKIVSWTIPEELTASSDEVQEALEEGVTIEYSAFPVEIIGRGKKVSGVRFMRTRLTDELMRNGWHRPEPVDGTDFVIEADHVIVAIGQSADATQLNLEGLDIDKKSGTIKVNPLTLETSLSGVFAGGDCMRGPNNVVEAMADGLRAAESIDRFLSDVDLEEGRRAGGKKVAEVDLSTVWAFPVRRADMPYLDMEGRKNTYEETTTGFSSETAVEESQRCLSCALCSECLECVKVCKAGAINHAQSIKYREIEADIVLKFPSKGVEISEEKPAQKKGVYNIDVQADTSPDAVSARTMSAVMQSMLDSDLDFLAGFAASPPGGLANEPDRDAKVHHDSDSGMRQGLFLCRCNGENSAAIDFDRLQQFHREGLNIPHISTVDQLCTAEGAREIAQRWKEAALDRAIVAACRCCNFEQVCYSCNDRRILGRSYLEHEIPGAEIEYINIRELCAWAHSDDREAATAKAARLVEAAALGADRRCQSREHLAVNPSAAFIGVSGVSRIAAMTLEVLGYKVFQIEHMRASVSIVGQPGDYEIRLSSNGKDEVIRAGAIVVDDSLGEADLDKMSTTYTGRLLVRLIRDASKDGEGTVLSLSKYASALGRAGLFINAARDGGTKMGESVCGVSLAASVVLYLKSNWVTMHPSAVRVEATLCRGCAACAAQCPLVEMREGASGLLHSHLERFLCAGCGACTSVCPTGAIHISRQDQNLIGAALRSYLGPENNINAGAR